MQHLGPTYSIRRAFRQWMDTTRLRELMQRGRPFVLTGHVFAGALMVALQMSLGCGPPGDSKCTESARELEYEELTVSGVSAERLMDSMGGSFSGSLHWHGGGEVVDVQPASGSTQMELALSYVGGKAWLIERTAENLDPEERLACSDDLVFEAELAIQTADGSVAGKWAVDVVHATATTPIGVDIRPLSDWEGSFRASLARPEEWDPGSQELSLQVAFDHTGTAGEISLSATRQLPAEDDLENGLLLDAVLASWSLPRPP